MINAQFFMNPDALKGLPRKQMTVEEQEKYSRLVRSRLVGLLYAAQQEYIWQPKSENKTQPDTIKLPSLNEADYLDFNNQWVDFTSAYSQFSVKGFEESMFTLMALLTKRIVLRRKSASDVKNTIKAMAELVLAIDGRISLDETLVDASVNTIRAFKEIENKLQGNLSRFIDNMPMRDYFIEVGERWQVEQIEAWNPPNEPHHRGYSVQIKPAYQNSSIDAMKAELPKFTSVKIDPTLYDPVLSEHKSDITLDGYQHSAMLTADEGNYNQQLTNFGLSMAGHVADIANSIHKHLFKDEKLDREVMASHLGDILWYVAALSDVFGYDLSTVAIMNRKKLKEQRGK